MHNYNLTIVLEGGATSAKRKSAQEMIEKLVSVFKGKIEKVEDLGEKELAYPIKKQENGYYLNIKLQMEGSAAKGILAKLALDDSLLRYLLVKTE